MAIKLMPFDRDVSLLLNNDLTPAARSKYLADFAADAIKEIDAQNDAKAGYDVQYSTFVDGTKTPNLGSVRPDGTIVAEWDLINDLFVWIDQQLVKHAPVLTGLFAKSFKFYADDVEADPANPPQADEYAFVNVQPYARKIESGLSPKAPDGVFQVVAILAKGRFGNMAKIRFSYRSFGAPVGPLKTRQQSRAANRTPAIVITLR